jgi:predicted lipoprotein with Yx(FWY)xxD motif
MSRVKTKRFLGLAAALASVTAFAACGGSAAAPTAAATAAAAGAAPPAAARTTASTAAAPRARPARVVLRTAASRYGRVLVDRRGYALYLFTRDSGPGSRCSGACARAWPPYLAGTGRGVSGARSSLIGTTRRRDGRRQLMYAGHPLYYYVGDRAPGQILCQDAEEYGGHWWVVSPGGGAITAG